MPATAKIHRVSPPARRLHLDLAAVETGVPLEMIGQFTKASGLDMKSVYDIVIPARTLKHRRERNEALNLDESDRLARLARIFDQAVKVFGASDAALRWLQKPKKHFDGREPLSMVRTETGARLVEEMLAQIEYGMFA